MTMTCSKFINVWTYFKTN